jgi:hypothetical protein
VVEVHTALKSSCPAVSYISSITSSPSTVVCFRYFYQISPSHKHKFTIWIHNCLLTLGHIPVHRSKSKNVYHLQVEIQQEAQKQIIVFMQKSI